MGPWRALMGRARGRPRYLSPSPASSPSPSSSSSSSSSASASASLTLSSLILAKAEQHQPCPLTPNTPPLESHNISARLNERIWPGLGFGFPSPIFAQKNTPQNVDVLLEDAKDFLLDSSSTEGLGRPDLRFPEGSLQNFEQKKAWLLARASPAEFAAGTLSFKKNAGASLNDTKALLIGFLKLNAPKHAEDRFSMCNSMIRAPAFYGSEDFIIQADSVKRKRKKKMNKHKHRKLRRLARKSRK